jgi:hypothetical protein
MTESLNWKEIFSDLFDINDIYKFKIALTFYNLIEQRKPVFVKKIINREIFLEYIPFIEQ